MVTMEDVHRAIGPEEPDYEATAAALGQDALPFLAELARDPDAMTASKAVSLTGRIGGSQAVDILKTAAESNIPEVRIVAASAAGRLGKRAEQIIADLLSDGDAGVRKYAVSAVSQSPSPLLVSALESMRTEDADLRVRQRAERTLREIEPAG